jgi:hypothetical protein
MAGRTEEEEILELGDDGCFEIPISAVEKPAATHWYNRDSDDTETEHKRRSHSHSQGSSSESQNRENGPFTRIGSNEFKIIREGNHHINVIVCYESELDSPKYRLSESVVVVDIADGKQIHINLPVKIKPATASSKYFGKYLAVKLEVAGNN